MADLSADSIEHLCWCRMTDKLPIPGRQKKSITTVRSKFLIMIVLSEFLPQSSSSWSILQPNWHCYSRLESSNSFGSSSPRPDEVHSQNFHNWSPGQVKLPSCLRQGVACSSSQKKKKAKAVVVSCRAGHLRQAATTTGPCCVRQPSNDSILLFFFPA